MFVCLLTSGELIACLLMTPGERIVCLFVCLLTSGDTSLKKKMSERQKVAEQYRTKIVEVRVPHEDDIVIEKIFNNLTGELSSCTTDVCNTVRHCLAQFIYFIRATVMRVIFYSSGQIVILC